MSEQPPSTMASSGTLETSNLVIIPFDDQSDGKLEIGPKDPKWDWEEVSDANWRMKLADLWMQKKGWAEAGKNYIFDKLPAGFRLFDRTRPDKPNSRDKFLYGHPSGFTYNSPKPFFPHVYWLKTDPDNTTCACQPCISHSKGRVPQKRRTKEEMRAFRASEAQEEGRARRSSRSEEMNTQEQDSQEMETEEQEAQEKGTRVKRTRGRPKKKAVDDKSLRLPLPRGRKGNEFTPEWDDNWPMDEDGPLYWKIYMQKMKDEGRIDVEIEQFFNFDWFSCHKYIETYFVGMALAPAFVPRQGELVIWCYHFEGTLEFNEDTRAWEMLSPDGVWQGRPTWMCGVVSEIAEEKSSYLDIIEDTPKIHPLRSVWGFRVEMLPDPIGTNKDYSTRYHYLGLKCIKPFNNWMCYLHGQPREAWHPSIEHGLTVMASWCTVSHFRFVGIWPNAEIHAHGLWLGAEQITIKDTIRLKPFGITYEDTTADGINLYPETDPVDVMVVQKIALSLEGCREDPEDHQLATSTGLRVVGKVFTRDKNRLSRPCPFGNEPLVELTPDEADAAFNQVHMRAYGPWYRVAGGGDCTVNQVSILGRCYDPVATDTFFQTRRLDYDLCGVLNARRFSGLVDRRIPEGVGWFWGNDRVEILGISEMIDVEIDVAAEIRNQPAKWEAFMKIRSGRPFTEDDWDLAELPRNWGNSKTLEWKGIDKASTMRLVQSSDDEEEDSEEWEGAGPSGRGLSGDIPFRGKQEEEEEDEEEEEFDEEAANALLRPSSGRN